MAGHIMLHTAARLAERAHAKMRHVIRMASGAPDNGLTPRRASKEDALPDSSLALSMQPALPSPSLSLPSVSAHTGCNSSSTSASAAGTAACLAVRLGPAAVQKRVGPSANGSASATTNDGLNSDTARLESNKVSHCTVQSACKSKERNAARSKRISSVDLRGTRNNAHPCSARVVSNFVFSRILESAHGSPEKQNTTQRARE